MQVPLLCVFPNFVKYANLKADVTGLALAQGGA